MLIIIKIYFRPSSCNIFFNVFCQFLQWCPVSLYVTLSASLIDLFYLKWLALIVCPLMLTVPNRCSEKLHYKRRKEKEQLEKEKKEGNRRKRYQLDLRLFHIELFLFWGVLLVRVIWFLLLDCTKANWHSTCRSRSGDDDDDTDNEGNKERSKGLDGFLFIHIFQILVSLHAEMTLCTCRLQMIEYLSSDCGFFLF